MNIHNMLIPAMVALVCFVGSARAELREWTDTDGKTVKAEFVRKEVESVVLRREDGTELKVAFSLLSDADQDYVMLRTPPRIEINMEPSVDAYTVGYLGNGGYDYTVKYQVVEPSVLLRKTSTDPYYAPLTMQVVIIGRIREVNRYIIIDNTAVPFTFTGQQSYEVTYRGFPLDLRQIKGSWKSGVEYEGYLVAVRDSSGAIVAAKASKLALEEHADEVSSAAAGSMLTRRLRIIQPQAVVVPDTGYEEPQLTF